MFEDITKNKKELLKKVFGLDLTTKLCANTIARKVVEENKYNTGTKLTFEIGKFKNGILKMTLNHNGKNTEYVLRKKDKLIFTHHFNVEM